MSIRRTGSPRPGSLSGRPGCLGPVFVLAEHGLRTSQSPHSSRGVASARAPARPCQTGVGGKCSIRRCGMACPHGTLPGCCPAVPREHGPTGLGACPPFPSHSHALFLLPEVPFPPHTPADGSDLSPGAQTSPQATPPRRPQPPHRPGGVSPPSSPRLPEPLCCLHRDTPQPGLELPASQSERCGARSCLFIHRPWCCAHGGFLLNASGADTRQLREWVNEHAHGACVQ